MTDEATRQIVALVREFVRRDVEPVASQHDAEDTYPTALVETMREMGLFGLTIPTAYGGLGLSQMTLIAVFEELAKGWMSLCGVLGTHLLMAQVIADHGTDSQRNALLPQMATGEIRGGLAQTEPNAGSDVQAIQTTAKRDGDAYVINGTKHLITNAVHGNAFLLVAKTDTNADPPYRGISCFIIRKPTDGLSVGRHVAKLGYRGIDTAELVFDNCRVDKDALVGGIPGRGFGQVMSGLECGRINVAARAVGVAQAAFDAAIRYAQSRQAFGLPICTHQGIRFKLAEMATKIEAARLLTQRAAQLKDAGERVDMAAGMAKLYASEICGEVTLDAMRIHGGIGYTKDLPIERYYRDAPLMIIGEGTNEMQKLIIAKRLLELHAI